MTGCIFKDPSAEPIESPIQQGVFRVQGRSARIFLYFLYARQIGSNISYSYYQIEYQGSR